MNKIQQHQYLDDTSHDHRRYISAVILIALLILPEGKHFVSPLHLPESTLAVFFLAGRYLRHWASWPVLFAINFACDYFVIHYRGVSDFCFTPSYGFLILAYGAMWLGGFYSRSAGLTRLSGIATLVAAVLVATAMAFLISNSSFYWLSGRYPDPHFTEYVERALMYMPRYMESPWVWLAGAASVEFIVIQWRDYRRAAMSHD